MPFVTAKHHLIRATRLWAADKLKKKETLPSWMAMVNCEAVKTECPLHIRGIIARQENAIEHNINTLRLHQVTRRSISWPSECTMSFVRPLIG